MILPAYINVNRSGIPTLSSNSVIVTTSEVQFEFNNHRNIGNPYRGLLIIRLEQPIPTGTTATLPIVFTTSNKQQNLIGYNNTNITVGDIKGTGIYLCWYESQSNTLQLL